MKSGRLNTAALWLALVAMAFLNWGPTWSARNGSGTMTVPNSFTPNTTISSADFNENFTDIANEITNSLALDGQSTMTGQLKAANGTAALPGITFGSDPDSGLYRIGANNIGIGVNETKILDIGTAGLGVTGTITPSGQIVGAAGSASAPGYSFTGDLNTGIYAIGADNIGIAAGGTKIVDVATTGVAVTGTLASSGATTITATSASSLAVGRQGATAPVLQVDASTSSVATGIKITGAAATGGVAIAAISSGTNENLTIDAKGSGTIGIAPNSTGAVTITPATTITGALTANAAGGVTAKNTAKAFGYATYSGGTPTLQSGSFNVASITDTGNGQIKFTFTNAMADALYSVAPEVVDSNTRIVQVVDKQTTYVEIKVFNTGGSGTDPTGIGFIIFSGS